MTRLDEIKTTIATTIGAAKTFPELKNLLRQLEEGAGKFVTFKRSMSKVEGRNGHLFISGIDAHRPTFEQAFTSTLNNLTVDDPVVAVWVKGDKRSGHAQQYWMHRGVFEEIQPRNDGSDILVFADDVRIYVGDILAVEV
jgi:hypothetical protein